MSIERQQIARANIPLTWVMEMNENYIVNTFDCRSHWSGMYAILTMVARSAKVQRT